MAHEEDIYKGEGLTLHLKEYGYDRLDGESDWEFRQRIFPDFYLKNSVKALESLMGSGVTEWGEAAFFCIGLLSKDSVSSESLERFARDFAEDPIVMREQLYPHRA